MIPDDETVPLTSQHGTPWRSISFDSISGGQTTSRGRYPDWAMLDLFAVPFLQQEPYVVDTSGNPVSGTIPPIRALTFGGSTEGKININNPSVPYPFSQSFSGVSQTPPTRVLPMNALFYGLQPSNSYNPSTRDPIYTAVDPSALTLAVQSYLSTNGPFMLPGELANVPAIANFTYRGVAAGAQSRNDLLKSVMGAICTQSNTYSIWIVAQTFKKAPGNTDYSKFEPGDKVTGEERKRIIVERYIDVGKDGVPGNASNKTYSGRAAAGPDGIVGTPDDELDADYNPPMTYPLPYRWKVLSSEDSNS